jgi:hypothetical protein
LLNQLKFFPSDFVYDGFMMVLCFMHLFISFSVRIPVPHSFADPIDPWGMAPHEETSQMATYT